MIALSIYQRSVCFTVTFLVLSFCVAHGQRSDALDARPVQDYFQDVESKSYFQQERIRSMKEEMNRYSRKLHDLQDRFDRIFYGNSGSSGFRSPFDPENPRGYPQRNFADEVVESPPPPPTFEEDGGWTNSNQLAFEVDRGEIDEKIESSPVEPTESSEEEPFERQEEVSSNFSFNPTLPNLASSGLYLIFRPGITFPYSTKSHGNQIREKKREYKPGELLSLSMGYDWGRFTLGGGVLYRRNKHRGFPDSYERIGGVKHPFVDDSHSQSWAGFVEIGYEHPLAQSFGLFANLGLGYGVSIVEDFAALHQSDRTRKDPFFLASPSFGLSWDPTQHFSLQLGYRYLYEDEVPAHAAQLGFKGTF